MCIRDSLHAARGQRSFQGELEESEPKDGNLSSTSTCPAHHGSAVRALDAPPMRRQWVGDRVAPAAIPPLALSNESDNL
eukprot:833129-Alexandrium_andersonii.AAC.1